MAASLARAAGLGQQPALVLVPLGGRGQQGVRAQQLAHGLRPGGCHEAVLSLQHTAPEASMQMPRLSCCAMLPAP